jgi:segregation and condensation protein B
MSELAPTQQPAPGIRLADLRRDVEALLFASGEPIGVDSIVQALGADDATARRAVDQILAELAQEFPAEGERGFELVRLAGGWAFRTNRLSENAVKALFELPSEAGKLSPASMECLAIVAYLQPVTRPQIAEIRGVNSDSPIRNLLDRELIVDVGRALTKGGAVLYATSRRFEAMFGLADLKELPPLDDFALTEEAKADLRRRLGLLTVPE